MLTILEKAARGAGSIALSYFHKEAHIARKTSHQNLVTEADTASQAYIMMVITDELKKRGITEDMIGFVGEENVEKHGSKHTFIIDPLDGTNNFASGLDYFCVSIAHVMDGKVQDGVIYWPSRDTLYFASVGKGAYKIIKGGSPTKLSVKDELLENCVIFTYLSSRPEVRKTSFALIEQIFSQIRGIRIQGSLCLDIAHLCDSENATHITLNFHGWLWDVAAGYLIVKESGGIFADLNGNELEVDYEDSHKQYSFIAAHKNVIKALTAYLS